MEESEVGRRGTYMTKQSATYITRCDIGWYSKNANAYRKPLEVATKYDTTLCVNETCRVPEEIAEICRGIVRFEGLRGLLTGNFLSQRGAEKFELFTGFDFPCMFKAWRMKKRFGCRWTVFLWDPPCLSHRDRFPPFRWLIDALFRFFAKRCDKLVLNIHPGLLGEIGYKPHEGQLELRMQDAWTNAKCKIENVKMESVPYEYDFGVLSNWERGKGGPLMVEAMAKMPGKRCLWIGNPPRDGKVRVGIEFAGRLSQEEAFARLKRCRVLVVPYLPIRALKWNYPLKLYEYLQIGRPIVSSDNPGNVTIAAKYPGRITLFKSGDVDELTAKLRSE